MKILTALLMLASTANAQWTPRMDSLARYTECKYKLPPGTCKAFSLQESNHQRHAIRTEANYVEANGAYAKKVRSESLAFSRANGGIPSYLTEVYQRGTSFGQFQIMGINLRWLGYKGKYLNEIRVAEMFDMFGRFVANLRKRWAKQSDWVAAYNAGSPRKRNGRYVNQHYVDRVTRYISQFSY